MKIDIDVEVPNPKAPLTPKQKWKLAWQLMRQIPEGRVSCDWADDLSVFVNPSLLGHYYIRFAYYAHSDRAMDRFTGDYMFHIAAIRKKYGDVHAGAYGNHHHAFLMSRLAVERDDEYQYSNI
ncbi:hypothetical protein [Photobacterium profundum]|uniref:Uncharacterized protein n=1 Tax=Photobacterium profundum (strain SS9) TaxID=298386 RepID=Q6LGP9_PHOPR|nr:hypothetical protein [Photobacterium profundum]CAG23531.1 Hypothetical protein PBPRB1671 [Photobacterium profundum SS9]